MAGEPFTDTLARDEPLVVSDAAVPPQGVSQYRPDQVERMLFEIQSEQSLVFGTIAGVLAGVAGALLWAGVTVATSMQIGWLAIGIGFLVGVAVRWGGRGTTAIFGVVGGGLALASVVVGNFLSLLGLLAGDLGLSYIEIATQFDYSQTLTWMAAAFSPIDLLFYGIAVWQGYQVSIREISADEINQRLAAEGVTPERPVV